MSTTPQPGDLAVIIKSRHPENVGIIVQCDSWVHPGCIVVIDGVELKRGINRKGPALLVYSKGRPIHVSTTRYGKIIGDKGFLRAGLFGAERLRKLDFSTEQDETLVWAGLPIKHVDEVQA